MTQRILGVCGSLTIIDHHESAERDIASLRDGRQKNPKIHAIFEKELCAAELVWRFLYGVCFFLFIYLFFILLLGNF